MCDCGKKDCWCGELLSSGKKGYKNQITEEELREKNRELDKICQKAKEIPSRHSLLE
jgi:hypothetical protein